MRKILFVFHIFFVFSFFQFEQANAKTFKNLRLNQTIENAIKVNKKLTLELSSGEWTVGNKHKWTWFAISEDLLTIVQFKGKEITRFIEIYQLKGSLYPAEVNDVIMKTMFYGDKEGSGCRTYKGNALLSVYKKGSAHNCLRVRHIDTQRYFYSPKKHLQTKEGHEGRLPASEKLKLWVERNNLTFPEIMLSSMHSYFSRSRDPNWIIISYFEDPKFYGLNKKYNPDKYNSEFHPNRINKFPEVKKVMNRFLEQSIERQTYIEKSYKVPKKQILKLVVPPAANKTKTGDLANKLKQLSDLYEKGALTKEEYNKAKEQLLK